VWIEKWGQEEESKRCQRDEPGLNYRTYRQYERIGFYSKLNGKPLEDFGKMA
jgi:hypothetical protein